MSVGDGRLTVAVGPRDPDVLHQRSALRRFMGLRPIQPSPPRGPRQTLRLARDNSAGAGPSIPSCGARGA
jgi:hypothetical protein